MALSPLRSKENPTKPTLGGSLEVATASSSQVGSKGPSQPLKISKVTGQSMMTTMPMGMSSLTLELSKSTSQSRSTKVDTGSTSMQLGQMRKREDLYAR